MICMTQINSHKSLFLYPDEKVILRLVLTTEVSMRTELKSFSSDSVAVCSPGTDLAMSCVSDDLSLGYTVLDWVTEVSSHTWTHTHEHIAYVHKHNHTYKSK